MIRKDDSKINYEIDGTRNITAHGGHGLLEKAAEKLGLWELIENNINIKKRKSGYNETLFISSMIHTLAGGGTCLDDTVKLRVDVVWKKILGVPEVPAANTFGEFFRCFSSEALSDLNKVLSTFVKRIISQAERRRFAYGKWVYCFLDHTHLEVDGNNFENAAINYNGDKSIGAHMFYIDQFLGGIKLLQGNAFVTRSWSELLGSWGAFFEKHNLTAHVFVDSAYYDGKIVNRFEKDGMFYSMTVNKATEPLLEEAENLPEESWTKGEYKVDEEYSEFIYEPDGWDEPRRYVVVRFKKEGELFWRYAFRLTNRLDLSPEEVFGLHRCKGEHETYIGELLNEYGLHHPRMAAFDANEAYYLIAALAYNLIIALKMLVLDTQWLFTRVKRIRFNWLLIPGVFVKHARREVVKLVARGETADRLEAILC